ncbi:RadC family protein [Blautia luti]|uniref:DNA repair protein RadC n=1 Tax=Blautia luti DSM 14534 = JCM 17040 TaxID=649762 RepID=A0A844GMS1_9FIRM|nr:DNA repair protein RadC [Blautia luti]MTD61971.1 DNA repair protein RadC [Blautia luti DSM 14534 = JCM 17040]RHQ89529.1 JAB domain-containing protein [Ruminococcus sp. AF21-42]
MKNIIKNLPEDQRPYEKCFYQGEDTLSDSELLAVILRSGTREQNSLSLAQTVLQYMEKSSYSGLMGLLHISVEDLMKIHGIGRVKAVQLKCIGELSKRIATTAARSQLSLNSPGSIAAYYMEQLRHEEQELVICMMVDVKGHFLGDKILSRGTATSSLVTPREIYIEALRRHAISLIMIHNHPSGDPSPSPEDVEITERIYQAGEILGIPLLDHIVIGDHRYCSFVETGLWETCTG